MDKIAIGSRVRALRKQRGMTLRDLEDASGVSYQYVSALETAAPNANVTVDTLNKILAVLGASLEVRGELPEAHQQLERTVAQLSPEQVARLVRIAAALPSVSSRTADVLTLAFEGAAEDARR